MPMRRMKLIGFVFTAVTLLVIGYLVCYFNWLPEIIGFFRNTAAEIGELFH